MSSDSPPTKRQRTRDEDAVMKQSAFWFIDGSVVLQAENTQFRVHFGVLARHSTIFRDMQGLPQPSDEPTVDGCPVVKLQDDPMDVEYLLESLYDSHSQEKKLQIPALGALIRLGRKLPLNTPQRLRNTMCLADTFDTIEEYDGIDFDMVTLLSENNILSAMPCACYRAVNLSTLVELFDGKPESHGTRPSLSQTDLRRCAIGQQRLARKLFQPGYTLGWARKWEFHDCTSPVTCRASRENIWTSHMEDSEVYVFLVPRYFLGRYNFCAACTLHATESMTVGRNKIWQELPEIFDLPPWNELRNNL
ncbi:BTB domain-containing protein [Mycena sanguinolenta]|uniref:BTB domain-containing protein n=1 Tax=Mycena sanguinolenta TaxID=230812 RepID=A0A8H6Z0G9_9AGAR|nr:BTB domain-containing protein [Mycena sanguinolenta]